MATAGSVAEWGLHWLAWELVGKVTLGVVVGTALGWCLAKVAFRSRLDSLRVAETGEPLLALVAILLTYGVAEVVGGYGFLAVFACAMTLRSAERGHDYHAAMHQVVERLERLLTLAVLLLLGVALTNGLLEHLTWGGAVLGVLLVFVLRPVTAWVALVLGGHRDRVGSGSLGRYDRLATAFFGVRGVGSLYYVAYATGKGDFANPELIWSVVGFTVCLSVLVHGVTATPVMARLDASRDRSSRQPRPAPSR
jgi:NhaP-type Na+/H+ or K+/H+ antiporter